MTVLYKTAGNNHTHAKYRQYILYFMALSRKKNKSYPTRLQNRGGDTIFKMFTT